jgi:pimeloyl-ACP methyl ester carboxylesterase
VLVHGWQGTAFDKPDCERPDLAYVDALWHHLDQDLEALGFEITYARLRSGPSFDEPDCTPLAEDNAPYVAEAIDEALAANPGQSRVILVAHSMGGLVSRAYLEGELYRDDVVALFTLGSPHVGVPVDVLAELVEILTLGQLNLEQYCVAQPVVCQFSDNEAENPPGFGGIETFNEAHATRARGVAYHFLGGDVAADHRGWLAEILSLLIPGPDDGIVPLPSAMGISSADDGLGPPLPRLGPLSGVIDRLQVYAVHGEGFADDPSIPFTCDFHYTFHGKDRLCANWDLSVFLDEEFRSETFYDCLEPRIGNRLPGHTCGQASDLGTVLREEAPTEMSPSPVEIEAWTPPEFGVVQKGQEAAHSFWLEGGIAVLLAHSRLDEEPVKLGATLLAPDGRVIDPIYAAAHPGEVRFKGDGRAALYLLLDASPGLWQMRVHAVEAPSGGLGYRMLAGTGAYSPTPEPSPSKPQASAQHPDRTAPMLPATASGSPPQPELQQSPHTCTIDNTGPYLPGAGISVTFELEMLGGETYVEWLDGYFVDAPDGWQVQSQSPPPDGDMGGWGRATVAESCVTTTLAYWGVEQPFLSPLTGTCQLGLAHLPGGGTFNGPWARHEAYAALASVGFEGIFPPAGWNLYLVGGGDNNHGFQQTGLRAHTGVYSAYHDDDDAEFLDPIETWLVLPQHTVQAGDTLAFWQNENYGSYYDYHGVWISTGSADPEDGDYVELAELGPGVEDAWEQVRLDLSAFSGKEAYLAFRYEGDYSDEWYLDDVSIERLRLQPTVYSFETTYAVADDPAHQCPGSPYVGVSSWLSDTRAGLVGVALGDLVDQGINAANCGIEQPCPLPSIAMTKTVSVDGSCPGSSAVSVPVLDQEVTLCYEVKNTGLVTVSQHTLEDPSLGGMVLSDTVTLGPGQDHALELAWNPGGSTGECFEDPATWKAGTPPGLGQPQGATASVPFTTTSYTSQAASAARVCVTGPPFVLYLPVIVAR